MAKNENHGKKINFYNIQERLNIVTLGSIFFVSFLIVLIFLIGYFNLKHQNMKLVNEKNEQVFKIYLSDVFQKISLLSSSIPFLDYLRSASVSRKELESEMLNNFSHYISDEIKGYKLVDSILNEIITVGKITDSYLLLDLCYINNNLNLEFGLCKEKLYVYFDKNLIFKKIQKIEPSVLHCSNCSAFGINNDTAVNEIYIIKSHNFKIPFTVEINNYSQTLFFIIVSLFIIVFTAFLTFYLNRKYLNNYICIPLNRLFDYVKNESNRGPFILEEIIQIADKIDDLKDKIRTNEKIKKQEELTKLAQVAHDIRSPLAALNTFFTKAPQLPEENRIMVRNAIQRMQDIANSLVLRHQKIFSNDENKKLIEAAEPKSVQLLSCLIDSLISEKRMQYRDCLEIEIEGNFGVNSYGLFSEIQPKEFKRILSNLINNAVESLSGKGSVSLDLVSGIDTNCLSIKDNGKGIPSEILPKLMERGATFGKIGGSGLGLHHAKTLTEQWGGKLEIQSQPNHGTQILLTLPKVHEPSWFVSTLYLEFGSTLVIIDDDTSIHNIWNERFNTILKEEHNIKVIHFSNPKSVLDWHEKEDIIKLNKILYLCDYEFIDHKLNGLELISKLNIYKKSILVTSRFEEETFREKCEKMRIKMIPKNLTGFVPIKILNSKENDCVILIDDDLFIHSLWKMSSQEKKVVCFLNAELFLKEFDKYEFDVPIYIDSDLGNGKKGEDISKKIYEMGFKNIYLVTGYEPDVFPAMPWIKGVIGKQPPWMM